MFRKIFGLFFPNSAMVKKNILHIMANVSLSDRIEKGKYDWVNGNIIERNFRDNIAVDYNVEYKLFHFDCFLYSDDAIQKIKEEGYTPGNIIELLCIGEMKPELQREFPIVALDSYWCHLSFFDNTFDDGHVVYLGCHKTQRELCLGWFNWQWFSNCRFLGVRRK